MKEQSKNFICRQIIKHTNGNENLSDVTNNIYNHFTDDKAPLIEALEEAKKSKWIPITESLPKHRSYVVISYWSGYDIAEYKHGCFFVGLNRITDVKYWMPLENPETALLNAKAL